MNLRLLRPPRKFVDWSALAIGAVIASASGYATLMGWASTTWPKVDGVVTYSEPDMGHGKALPKIDVRYKFSIAGHEYTGGNWRYRVVIGRDLWQRTWLVQAVQASYPVGERVTVSVRPDNATDSVLEPGVPMENIFWLSAGLLFMLAAFMPGREERRASGMQSSGRASIVSLAGLALLLIGAYWIYRGMASEFWPTAPGKVLYSATYGNWGKQTNYQGEVRYEYHVGGTRYLGDQTQYGPRETAAAWVKANPVGHGVTVHYNPLDASDSELLPGITWRDFILPAIGLAMLAAVRWWRMVKPASYQP